MTRVRAGEFHGLTSADLLRSFKVGEEGVGVTLKGGVTLRWDSVADFADWMATIDDMIWGLLV